jgi:RNA polymerase sigma-70 factor (ECF subfamily)
MGTIDAQEAGRWFERESNALVLYARQWLDPAAAEDAVQDVFVSLMLQSPPPDHLKPWLFRAVRNRAFKTLRADHRRLCREERMATETPACFEPRPDDALDAQAAEAALRALPPEEREVVTLRLWGGLTLEEIAAVLACSIATVFRRYQAALDGIRQHMEASWTREDRLTTGTRS